MNLYHVTSYNLSQNFLRYTQLCIYRSKNTTKSDVNFENEPGHFMNASILTDSTFSKLKISICIIVARVTPNLHKQGNIRNKSAKNYHIHSPPFPEVHVLCRRVSWCGTALYVVIQPAVLSTAPHFLETRGALPLSQYGKTKGVLKIDKLYVYVCMTIPIVTAKQNNTEQ